MGAVRADDELEREQRLEPRAAVRAIVVRDLRPQPGELARVPARDRAVPPLAPGAGGGDGGRVVVADAVAPERPRPPEELGVAARVRSPRLVAEAPPVQLPLERGVGPGRRRPVADVDGDVAVVAEAAAGGVALPRAGHADPERRR